jgi:reverse transcriptase-like protein
MDIIQWVESFLTDCKTIMVLFEGAMGEFNVKIGIPQGSPLSPILFLFFFNADLIEDLLSGPGHGTYIVVGYIDDIAILVWSESAAECQLLARIHGNAEAWGGTHAAKFSPKITGIEHVRQLREKATELIAALSSIAGSTWGTNTLHLRSIYTAV